MILENVKPEDVNRKVLDFSESHEVYFRSDSTVFEGYSDFVVLKANKDYFIVSHVWIEEDKWIVPADDDQILMLLKTSVTDTMTVNDLFVLINDFYDEYMDLSRFCSDPGFKVAMIETRIIK